MLKRKEFDTNHYKPTKQKNTVLHKKNAGILIKIASRPTYEYVYLSTQNHFPNRSNNVRPSGWLIVHVNRLANTFLSEFQKITNHFGTFPLF